MPPSTPRRLRPTSGSWPPISDATLDFPGMMVGPLEGRFLELLTFALGAPLGPRDRDVRWLLGPLHGRRPGSRWPHRDLRDLAASTPSSPAVTSPPAPTPSAIEVVVGPAIDSIASLVGPVRPGLHRRRQVRLSGLLRGGPAQARAPGRDRRRQHPVERPGARPVRRQRGHAWPSGSSTTRWPSTPGWSWCRRRSATESPSSGGPGRGGAPTCWTTTSISGRTRNARPRPPSSR